MKKLEKEFRRRVLLKHINNYINKRKIQMKGLLTNLKVQLESGGKITINQLNSIIPFLQNEKQFKEMNRNQIVTYFNPIIKSTYKEFVNVSSNQLEC